MKNRFIKDILYTPAFYILLAVFLFITAYVFYSLLLTYINATSFYPEQMFYNSFKQNISTDLDVNTNIFPSLFNSYVFLIILIIPVLVFNIFNCFKTQLDKFDLLCTGETFLSIFLKKISAIIIFTLVPVFFTILYPLSLSFFAVIDWGLIISAYIGLFLLLLLFTSMNSLVGVINVQGVWGVVVNISFSYCIYNYFLKYYFSSFFLGNIKIALVFLVLILCFILTYLSIKIEQAKRLWG